MIPHLLLLFTNFHRCTVLTNLINTCVFEGYILKLQKCSLDYFIKFIWSIYKKGSGEGRKKKGQKRRNARVKFCVFITEEKEGKKIKTWRAVNFMNDIKPR